MLGSRYHWVAKYMDGTLLPQVDPSGAKHAYKDINRDTLAAFELWEGSSRALSIRFTKGQRLIWRRRVQTTPGGITEVCHIVAKQEEIKGKNYQTIVGLFESDARMEVADRFDGGHPWFYPVTIHTNEGEVWKKER